PRVRQDPPQLRRIVRPAQRRMAPERRRKPGIENVLVTRERSRLAAELRPRLRARVALVARDMDIAGIVVPRGDLVTPPQLARNRPVLDIVDPVVIRGN